MGERHGVLTETLEVATPEPPAIHFAVVDSVVPTSAFAEQTIYLDLDAQDVSEARAGKFAGDSSEQLGELLLSADLSYAAAPGAALDAALRIADVDGTQMLQLLDNGSGSVLGQQALVADINVTVFGSDLNDALLFDLDSAFALHTVTVAFDGRAGDDTLKGSKQDTAWTMVLARLAITLALAPEKTPPRRPITGCWKPRHPPIF